MRRFTCHTSLFFDVAFATSGANGETRMEHDSMDAKGRIDNSWCACLTNDAAKKFAAVEGFLILTFLSFDLCKRFIESVTFFPLATFSRILGTCIYPPYYKHCGKRITLTETLALPLCCFHKVAMINIPSRKTIRYLCNPAIAQCQAASWAAPNRRSSFCFVN